MELVKITVPSYVFEYDLIMANAASYCKGYLTAVCLIYIKLLLSIYISCVQCTLICIAEQRTYIISQYAFIISLHNAMRSLCRSRCMLTSLSIFR